MKNKDKAEIIASYLMQIYPDAHCELNYKNDYELLIAVLLSAQTSDVQVNKATANLFNHFTTLEELDKASVEEIKKDILFLGLADSKAKHIKSLVHDLLTKYNGIVPRDKKDLMSLSGVGNKTANVVRLELFHECEMPVDTHILRLSKRFGFVSEKVTPYECELKLRKLFKKEQYYNIHHQLIYFGRRTCKAINPMCDKCYLQLICKEYQNKHK